MTKPASVDEYLRSLDEVPAARLRELRRLSCEAAPTATECLKWGSPAYVHEEGTILFVFSAFKKHANFVFTPSTRAAFDDELVGFETGKGSIKIPYTTHVPRELLQRMIAHRIQEFEIDGVKWM